MGQGRQARKRREKAAGGTGESIAACCLTPTTPKASRPRRKWWQRLIRLTVVMALGLAALYVTFPWWVPREMVKNALARDLSGKLGAAVRIERIELSWSGVELTNLSIASPPGFDDKPVVTVARVRTEYSPTNALFRKRLAWLELDQPEINVVLDGNGNSNLAVLPKLDNLEPKANRISIRRAKATLTIPSPVPGTRPQELALAVNDMQLASGRLSSIGNMTMSAVLSQSSHDAPLSLRMSGGDDPAVAATGQITFSRIDLGQFNLPLLLSWLNVPVKQLSGTAEGSLHLQIDRQLVVNRFSLDTTIRRLDVQPTIGPHIPVIEKAGLHVAAAVDPITDRIDIYSASVDLPGIDIKGQGTLVGWRQLDWRVIRSVDVNGTVFPAQLAALWLARPPEPGEPAIDGPVTFQAVGGTTGQRLALKTSVDCTDASVAVGGKIVKPAKRPLRLSWNGDVDQGLLQLNTKACEVVLGGNRLSFDGSIRDMQQVVEPWRSGRVPPLATILKQLTSLDLHATAEITELASLRDVCPEAADALKDVDFAGTMTGTLLVTQNGGTRVTANLQAPESTTLEVKRRFTKPHGSKAELKLSVMVDAEGVGLRNMDMDVKLGDGLINIDRATLTYEGENAGRPIRLKTSGAVILENVDRLAAAFHADHPRDLARGNLEAQFDAAIDKNITHAKLQGDVGHLEIAAGAYFRKPADQAGSVTVEYDDDTAAEPAKRMRVTAKAQIAKGEYSLAANLGPAVLGQGDVPVSFAASANISDAAGALPLVPQAWLYLQGRRVQGPLAIEVKDGSYLLGKDKAIAAVEISADKLDMADVFTRRAKPPGVICRAKFTAAVSGLIAGDPSASLDGIQMTYGDSEMHGSAGAQFARGSGAITTGRADLKGTLHDDDSLLRLLPELAEMKAKYKTSGQMSWTATADFGADGLTARVELDAAEMAAMNVGPLAIDGRRNPQGKALAIGPLTKPKGMPAFICLTALVPKDGSSIKVKNLHALAGGIDLMADAEAHLVPGLRTQTPKIVPTFADVAIVVGADVLARALPELSPYKLTGGIIVEAKWSGQDGKIPSLMLTCDGLKGAVGGKEVRLNGRIGAEDVAYDAGGITSAGRLLIDKLEFAIGENRGFIAADVAKVPAAPAGRVDVLCSQMDDRDLTAWITGIIKPAATSAPADVAPAERPAADPLAQAKAKAFLARMRALLTPADLRLHVGVDAFRVYDPNVEQMYDPKWVDIDLAAHNGHLELSTWAAVCGGTYSRKLQTKLGDDEPIVKMQVDIHDLLAMPNIQPQISRFFPGNNFYGTFSRREETQVPLLDLITANIDPTRHAYQTGTAVTVATDGEVIGRGAPSYVTAVFPGLDMTRYKYQKMTGFATFNADGSVDNDMIFSGSSYNLYIGGNTDASNYAQYEVGLILLGHPNSPEFDHLSRVGRIPLLTSKARIEKGQLVDEVVEYTLPTDVLIRPVYNSWRQSK